MQYNISSDCIPVSHTKSGSSHHTTSTMMMMTTMAASIAKPLILLNVLGAAAYTPDWDFPSELTLRGGVLLATPFATLIEEELGDGSQETLQFGGFQIDLLKRLQIFAAKDNVTLNIELQAAPIQQYGPALDLVAGDCNTTENRNTFADCQQFDFIVGNYYATPIRSLRTVLSPPLLRSSISAIKFLDKKEGRDFTTLKQAETARSPICLKDGTFYASLVRERFPDAVYYSCKSTDACINSLKAEECVLHIDDELQLRAAAAADASLEVTREQFNTQYIVWPFSNQLPQTTLTLMGKWIRDAITNATMDDLYFQYFQKAQCPIGTAGEQCELPCDPDHGEANARGVCICESTKHTGDDCSVFVPENVNGLPEAMVAAAYGMFAVNVILIFVCAGWLYWERKTTEVVVSQPFFLSMVLVGCLISSSTIVALAQEDDGDGPVQACMVIPWTYSVGFCITFGTLFAKIRRIFLIFRNANECRRNIVGAKETMAVIFYILAVDIAILIIWTVVDPLTWYREVTSTDQFGSPLESVGYCNCDYWLVWAGLIFGLHFLLMGVACYMCYASRDIDTRFSEGKYLSIAMMSNLQIFVVGVPILVIIGTDPQTGFFVRSVIIWMNDFVVVSLIFGNLMWSVHVDSDAENPETVNAAVGNAMRRYSTAQRARSSLGGGSSFGDGSAIMGSDSLRPIQPFNSTRAGVKQGTGFGESSPETWKGALGSLSDSDEDSNIDNCEEDDQSHLAPMPTFEKPADVLRDDRTSWGVLSMAMDSDEDSDEFIAPPPPPPPKPATKFERPVDVLRDDRTSWGVGTLSMIMGQNDDQADADSNSSLESSEKYESTVDGFPDEGMYFE